MDRALREAFAKAGALPLEGDQRDVLDRVRGVCEATAENYELLLTLAPRLAEDRYLELQLSHSSDSGVGVVARVAPHGRLEIWSEALHPNFNLCFNDRWEPDDCDGDLEFGLEVVSSLLEGRLRSDLTWGGGLLARSEDTLVRTDGSEVTFNKHYSLAGSIGRLRGSRHEQRSVSFVGAA